MKPREAKLTHEELTEFLAYDPETGILTWKKVRSNRVKVGAEAGNITPFGYRSVQIGKYGYLSHRLAWFFVFREWPADEIDHKDGNGLNNKIDNLRQSDSSQNKMNRRRRDNSRCGIKGVYLHKEDPPQYRAQIVVRRKKYHLGLFSTPEEAHAAYVAASLQHHGEYGRLS